MFFVLSATGARATQLAEAATKLKGVPSESCETIENLYQPTEESFQDKPGTQTVCHLLKSMATTTNLHIMDEETTVWQVVWTQVSWPQGTAEEICTKKGERLFPEIFIMDATGCGPRLRMTEASALSLARLQSKEEFLSNHAAGKHTFPVMASLKIIRRVTKIAAAPLPTMTVHSYSE